MMPPNPVADLARQDGRFRAIIEFGEAAMSTTTTTDVAEQVIATLRAHEAELRQAGIRRLSLFGLAPSLAAMPSQTATWTLLPNWTRKPA
jgi:hypothetical protein